MFHFDQRKPADTIINVKNTMKLLFATNNAHKFKEINEIAGNRINMIKLSDLGFTGDIPEDYHSLEDNASQKAFYIYERFGINCFSDDTGLEIEALNNDPGVFSARYAGNNCTSEDNIKKVLGSLRDIKMRKARFRTVIALIEKGKQVLFDGEVKGSITHEKKGKYGFGYDPIFQPEGYEKTFAEMQPQEKNLISHRKIAFQKLVSYLISQDQYNKG